MTKEFGQSSMNTSLLIMIPVSTVVVSWGSVSAPAITGFVVRGVVG